MRFEKELYLARSVAMHAGELALGYQTSGITAEEKPDLSPVTIADREAEKLIVKLITDAFPDDGLLGEEGTSKPSRNGRRWIIDPVDGTRDFVRGIDTWAVLIGFEVDGEVVAGAANFPARKEMYSALRGHGAFKNEKRLKISNIETASQSVLCLNGFNNLAHQPFAGSIIDWMEQFWAVRSMGGCMDAMMIAAGQAEVWIENTCKAWDLAPLKIIAEEAGARFMNFNGACSIEGGNVVIFVPALESEVRKLLGI
jgi:histidinol phosphatase-like enzyme (inositol monophosphatase family)